MQDAVQLREIYPVSSSWANEIRGSSRGLPRGGYISMYHCTPSRAHRDPSAGRCSLRVETVCVASGQYSQSLWRGSSIRVYFSVGGIRARATESICNQLNFPRLFALRGERTLAWRRTDFAYECSLRGERRTKAASKCGEKLLQF